MQDDATRRRFLDECRESSRRRYDESIWIDFDRDWGTISESHASCVDRLLRPTPKGGIVLDAACGTGKYWPLVLESGRRVFGTDQSASMLEVARSKVPLVDTAVVGLQEMEFDTAFDAVMCIDAMENVAPEDWPGVLTRLMRAARPGAHLYLTVELPDDRAIHDYSQAVERGDPVVEGEAFDGLTYHFYPTRDQVDGWVASCALAVVDDREADDYRHLLLRRSTG